MSTTYLLGAAIASCGAPIFVIASGAFAITGDRRAGRWALLGAGFGVVGTAIAMGAR